MAEDRFAGVSRTALLKQAGYLLEEEKPAIEQVELVEIRKHSSSEFIVSGMSAEVQNTLEDWNGEVPEDIKALVDNKQYMPAVKARIREFGLKYVRKSAELARLKSVAKPSHHFAKSVICVKNWHEKTLQILEDIFALEGFVLDSVGSISEKTKKFVFYIMGSIRLIGMEKFQDIMSRVKQAENPEHYLFGALNLARQEVADSPQ